MSLNGYDESNNQGDINNALVPGDFDIIKATEGVGYVDADCDANYQQAKAAGKLLGVYHFARPDGNDPVAEANWFVSQVQGYIGEAVLILDLEVQPITPGWAKAWLDRVYELTRVRGWLYTFQSQFNSGDWSQVWPNYAAWVASYGVNAPQNGYGAPTAPITIIGDWTIVAWQYTSKGILPGWGGALDLNVAYLDGDAWRRYAAGERTAPVIPATPVIPVTPPEPPVTPPADTTPPVIEPPVEPVIPAPPVTPPTTIPVSQEPSQTHDIPVAVTPSSWLSRLLKEVGDFLFGILRKK